MAGRRRWIDAAGAGRRGASSNLDFAAFAFAASSMNLGADVVRAKFAAASAWLRDATEGADVVCGNATVTNVGSVPDRIVGATIPGACPGTAHSMETAGGVMLTRRLDALTVDVGKTVVMRPGGSHLMYPHPTSPSTGEGQTVAGTVVFERSGSVPVVFRVGGVGAKEDADRQVVRRSP